MKKAKKKLTDPGDLGGHEVIQSQTKRKTPKTDTTKTDPYNLLEKKRTKNQSIFKIYVMNI